MISVRIQGQNYRVTNETLEGLFLGNWRDFYRLEDAIRQHHKAGRLVIDGRRLRRASAVEEAEHLLRSSTDRDEILRNGLLYLGGQLGQVGNELRALRELLEYDTSAATTAPARSAVDALAPPRAESGLISERQT